jgi:hypothetical protein
MLQRRPRTKRCPTGKRIELSERDLEIFRALRRYRYLRSTYLHAFAGGASETRFKERLGDLFHEGFIDRPTKQWEFAEARYRPAVYELGERGRRTLAEFGGEDGAARTYLAASAHRQFLHATMICDCLASIELAVRGLPHVRFIPWGEVLARVPESTKISMLPQKVSVSGSALIPDGLFGLEYQTEGSKAYRFFALEADLGTMPVSRSDSAQTSYLGKLALFGEVIARRLPKQHWGIPNLLVLTVTADAKRLENICRKLGGEPQAFLFKTVAPRTLCNPCPALLTEAWQRAGLPELSICQ